MPEFIVTQLIKQRHSASDTHLRSLVKLRLSSFRRFSDRYRMDLRPMRNQDENVIGVNHNERMMDRWRDSRPCDRFCTTFSSDYTWHNPSSTTSKSNSRRTHEQKLHVLQPLASTSVTPASYNQLSDSICPNRSYIQRA
jgi:hypothetical protein